MPLVTVGCVTGSRRKTPLRTLQVDDLRWADFGEGSKVAWAGRPEAIREFMDWVRGEPELWAEVRRVADERGETMRAAVHRALREYLDHPPR